MPPLAKLLVGSSLVPTATIVGTGFTRTEALGFFGKPPAGYDLIIDPLPAPMAQQRYLERYRVLAEAVGLVPAPDAWHTE